MTRRRTLSATTPPYQRNEQARPRVREFDEPAGERVGHLIGEIVACDLPHLVADQLPITQPMYQRNAGTSMSESNVLMRRFEGGGAVGSTACPFAGTSSSTGAGRGDGSSKRGVVTPVASSGARALRWSQHRPG